MSLNDGFKEAIGYLLSAFLPSSMVTNSNYISRTARDRADNKILSWARSGGYFHKNIQFFLFAEHIGVKFWAGKGSHWKVEGILLQLPLDARSLLFKLLGTNKSSGSLKI